MRTESSSAQPVSRGSLASVALFLVLLVALVPTVVLASPGGPATTHPSAVPFLSIAASPTSTSLNKPFVLSGSYFPVNDALVIVSVKKPGSWRWSYSSARATYGSDGKSGSLWWYRYVPKARGTYGFFASSVATASYPAETSTVISVKIR